jgi:hypothetical protein
LIRRLRQQPDTALSEVVISLADASDGL